jgi:hypothetical protein
MHKTMPCTVYIKINNEDIPGFSPYSYSYTYDVPFLTEKATVLAGQTDAGATYTVTPASPVTLNPGNNRVTLTVTAQNGTTKRNYYGKYQESRSKYG